MKSFPWDHAPRRSGWEVDPGADDPATGHPKPRMNSRRQFALSDRPYSELCSPLNYAKRSPPVVRPTGNGMTRRGQCSAGDTRPGPGGCDIMTHIAAAHSPRINARPSATHFIWASPGWRGTHECRPSLGTRDPAQHWAEGSPRGLPGSPGRVQFWVRFLAGRSRASC